MLIDKVRESLSYFPKGCRLTLDYVPDCFEFSGAPKNPSRLYMLVDEMPEEVSEEDEKKLAEFGWINIDDLGQEWVLYDH